VKLKPHIDIVPEAAPESKRALFSLVHQLADTFVAMHCGPMVQKATSVRAGSSSRASVCPGPTLVGPQGWRKGGDEVGNNEPFERANEVVVKVAL
jgi:hypothetical protein